MLQQLGKLTPPAKGSENLETLAQFLADVPAAWNIATPEQKSKLARVLFDQVWIRNKEVVGVKPRPELEPLFRLNYEEFLSRGHFEGRTPPAARARGVGGCLIGYLMARPREVPSNGNAVALANGLCDPMDNLDPFEPIWVDVDAERACEMRCHRTRRGATYIR